MHCNTCGLDNLPEASFCSNCGNALIAAATAVLPLHVIKIGVGASYGNEWRQLWKNFPILLLIFILTMLIVSPGSIAANIGQRFGGLAALGDLCFPWFMASFLQAL